MCRLFVSLTEKGEGRRSPEKTHERLHAVVKRKQGADQVRESRNLRHRDLKKSRRDVEADRQKPQRGWYGDAAYSFTISQNFS